MTAANATEGNVNGLPQELITAQEALNLPVVQEMLRKLSAYNLGICMPHMHDEQTGGFQRLADDLMQVETGLKVSFRPAEEVLSQPDRYLPVAWFWRDGATAPMASCKWVCEKRPGDSMHYNVHGDV
jgi:hypothetical protein